MAAAKTTEQFICADCVSDSYLISQIEEHGKELTCSYCGCEVPCYTIQKMADLVEVVINKHYERTSDQPSEDEYWRQHVDRESRFVWYREGQSLPEILIEKGGFPQKAAKEIQHILHRRNSRPGEADEQDFDLDACYEQKGYSDEKWQRQWDEFEQIVKTQSRFFSKKAYAYLKNIFSDLEDLKTLKNKPLVRKIGPKEPLNGLYRARVFQDTQEMLAALKDPDQLLGTPSSAYAKGGRMNAAGIPVFYGANNPELAIAEVRPPVGSRVVVAKFMLTRELRLLNTADFKLANARGSIFDPEHAPAMEKVMFLKKLGERIAMPVMPATESHDYLPTQLIADFLAEGLKIPYDGIIYTSTQSKAEGLNVVLFHRASRVASIPIIEGSVTTAHPTVMDVDIEEHENYNVIIQKPGKPHKKKPVRDHIYLPEIGFMPSPRVRIPEDPRSVTLQILENELQIFQIETVEVKKSPLKYKRTTIKKQGAPRKRKNVSDV